MEYANSSGNEASDQCLLMKPSTMVRAMKTAMNDVLCHMTRPTFDSICYHDLSKRSYIHQITLGKETA